MAQVTMSGQEYNTLMRKIAMLESVEEWIKKLSTFEFPEDEFNSWGTGKAPSIVESRVPEWVVDLTTDRVVKALLALDDETFRGVVDAQAHYYTPFDTQINHFSGHGRIDLLEYSPELKVRWNAAWEGEDE